MPDFILDDVRHFVLLVLIHVQKAYILVYGGTTFSTSYGPTISSLDLEVLAVFAGEHSDHFVRQFVQLALLDVQRNYHCV